MNGFKILWLMIGFVLFAAIPGVQAGDSWRLDSVGDLEVAFWRKADSSGLAIYFIPSGAVWLCVRIPKGTETINASRPIELRVDRSEIFRSPKIVLQPDPTAVAWEISAPGTVVKGSLLDRLMKGACVHVRCRVGGGREVETEVSLEGARPVIARLLSMRP